MLYLNSIHSGRMHDKVFSVDLNINTNKNVIEILWKSKNVNDKEITYWINSTKFDTKNHLTKLSNTSMRKLQPQCTSIKKQ